MRPFPFRLKFLVAGVAIALVGACSALPKIEGQKIDYKSAAQLPPLEIPPDLTRPQGDDRFVVPGGKPSPTATYSEYEQQRTAAKPSGNTVLRTPDSVRLERAGTQRWLVVKGTPDQIWPVVKDFWQEVGFVITVDMPDAGVMETDWNENRAKLPDIGLIRDILGSLMDRLYSSGERDKFRTRLEPGQEPGTTDIYISHRGMVEEYTSTTKENTYWKPRPPDPELEAEMLQRLMVRFGVQEGRAKTQVAESKGIVGTPRAAIVKAGDGTGILSVSDQFDRAWRRVGLALDRVGFTVEDRDRSKGTYFVRYIDADAATAKEKQGFLSRLKFWGNDTKAKSEQYRILIKEKDDDSVSEVSVLNKDGGQENSETANRILTLLLDQLK